MLSYRVYCGTLDILHHLSDPNSWLRTVRYSRSVRTEHNVHWRANSTLTITRNRAIAFYE